MKFLFTVPIEKCSGHLLFSVEAADELSAMKLVKSNTALHPVIYHEVQVLAVGEPKCLGLARDVPGEKGC